MQSRRSLTIDGLIRIALVALMLGCTMCSAQKKTSGDPPVVTPPSGVVPDGQNLGENPVEAPAE